MDALSGEQDRVDANQLGELIAGDPLMTLRLMAHVARLRGPRQSGHPQTVTAAIVWLGIGPFFRQFAGLQRLEQTLRHEPLILQQIEQLLARNRHASRLALAFGRRCNDRSAPLLHQAALLRDFGQLLLWIDHAQTASTIQAQKTAQPRRTDAEIECEHLGIALQAVERALLRAWRLSPILERVDDPSHGDEAQTRCVRLALRIADASIARPGGIVDAADLAELVALLDLNAEQVAALIADAGE